MDSNAPWRVLVVDDEEGVHGITRMIFRGYEFEGRPIELISAMSGAEARALLQQHPDICLALLDVVMESDDEGLRLVDHIRDTLGNRDMRLILRTGHPGFAPETDVIVRYDINDYLSKAELSASRLLTSVLVALRSYRDIAGARQPASAGDAPQSASPAPLASPLLAEGQQLLQRLLQLDLNPIARDLAQQLQCNQQRLQALFVAPEPDPSVEPVSPRALLEELSEAWLPLTRQQQRLLDLRLEEPLPDALPLARLGVLRLWSALLAHALHGTGAGTVQLALAHDPHSGELNFKLETCGAASTAPLPHWRDHWHSDARSACEQLCRALGGRLTLLADDEERLLLTATVGT